MKDFSSILVTGKKIRWKLDVSFVLENSLQELELSFIAFNESFANGKKKLEKHEG